MAPVLDEVPARVLAVYAHPDDADISCGGTLARWASEGAAVELVVATLGEKGSTNPADTADEIAERRRAEVDAATAILGISRTERLDYPDGDLENDFSLRASVVKAIRSFRPDTVVAPDPTAVFFGDSYVNHRDHRALGWAVLDAVSPAAANPHYFPDSGAAHHVEQVLLSGTLEPDVWVDIEPALDKKARAVASHKSQLVGDDDWAGSLVQERARQAAVSTSLAFAESFRLLRFA